MLTRLFDIADSARSLAGLRASLAMTLTRKTVFVWMAHLAATTLAMFGVVALLCAGYIALARHLDHAAALAIVGAVAVGLAAIVWLVASRHAREHRLDGSRPRPAESAIRARIAGEERQLRIAMGLPERDPARTDRSGPRTDAAGTEVGDSADRHSNHARNGTTRGRSRVDRAKSSTRSSANGLSDIDPAGAATVMLAAGIAAAGLLGPSRLVRTVRLATTIGSIMAFAKRLPKNR